MGLDTNQPSNFNLLPSALTVFVSSVTFEFVVCVCVYVCIDVRMCVYVLGFVHFDLFSKKVLCLFPPVSFKFAPTPNRWWFSETRTFSAVIKLAFWLKLNNALVHSLPPKHWHSLCSPHIIQLLDKHAFSALKCTTTGHKKWTSLRQQINTCEYRKYNIHVLKAMRTRCSLFYMHCELFSGPEFSMKVIHCSCCSWAYIIELYP